MFKRLMTGIFLVVFFVWLVLKAPPILLWLVLAGILGLSALEWRRLIEPQVHWVRRYMYAFMTCILAGMICLNDLFLNMISLAAFVPLLSLLEFSRFPKTPIGIRVRSVGYLLGWVLLLGFFSSVIYLLFFEERGKDWLLTCIAIIALSDSGAYFMGRWKGKHKLAPSISPGKTWEGVIGAFLVPLCTLPMAYLAGWSGAGVSGMHWALICVLLVPIGILGDLYESCYKRASGLKDSGCLLPGHGGILDRLDALLFALPVFVLVLKCL